MKTAKQRELIRSLWQDTSHDTPYGWFERGYDDSSRTIQALARQGLLEVSPEGTFRFTPKGYEMASRAHVGAELQVPKGLPPLLFLEPQEGDSRYRVGRRNPPRRLMGDVLIKGGYGPGVKRVWVCLDLDNGNPEMFLGRVYVWVFETESEAKAHVAEHKANADYTRLTLPEPFVLIRGSHLAPWAL